LLLSIPNSPLFADLLVHTHYILHFLFFQVKVVADDKKIRPATAGLILIGD
jgi:hypothetical protein